MDTKYLEECLAKIKVRNLVNQDVEVVNDSPLVMMGKGRQGAVFQVTDDICVKVFGNDEDCDREYYALSLGQHTGLFPKVYHKGQRHIAMEVIKGIDLREYLQSQPLTKNLSTKLIDMLITFKEIGYERIDHHKRQVYLQSDGSLKVIDVARTVWRNRVYPYPRKLLNSLGEKNEEKFLNHVMELSPDLYAEWKYYIRMEELAREIYQILLESPDENVDVVKVLSKKLLTTNDEEKFVVLMAGLMHKVFKEEWVKTMLARGVDPDVLFEEIDKYWDAQKLSPTTRKKSRVRRVWTSRKTAKKSSMQTESVKPDLASLKKAIEKTLNTQKAQQPQQSQNPQQLGWEDKTESDEFMTSDRKSRWRIK